MKKLYQGTIRALMLLAIILTITQNARAAGAEEFIAQQPVYHAGDYWIFRRAEGDTMKIEYIACEKDRFIFLVKEKESAYQLHKNLYFGNIKVIDDETGQTIFFKDSPPLFKFPLHSRKKWEHTYLASSQANAQITSTFNFSVAEAEKLSVKAGEFMAFKVKSSWLLSGVNDGKVIFEKNEFFYWYSPQVKYMIKKKTLDSDSMELVDYKVK